jgi:3-oxoacyl-(acyl-carrier-protein) synthase
MAYIKGIGVVSPQNTFNTDDFLSNVVEVNSNSLKCIEPSYKEFLNPALARRMGRVIKMSIAAAMVCLKDAGIEIPDAIMTGTGLGCTEDTEKFLLAILDNDEQFLTPTSFMQSTHNTVSAQIALQLKCMNYNFTYVHKGFSFESATIDALMTLNEGEASNILIGGHDEMTDNHFLLTSRVGYWKKDSVETMQLINTKSEGSISGEGAAFFVISNEKSNHDYAELAGVKTIYKLKDEKDVQEHIFSFLGEHNLTTEEIDVVLYGISGDNRYDGIYYDLLGNIFNHSISTYWKHLCGEYQTSSSFAFWVATMMLKTQSIPSKIIVDLGTASENKADIHSKPIQNILIYNNYMHDNHSLFLLKKC